MAKVRVTAEPQTIGRAATCALVLPSTGVSRSHASFYLHSSGVVIVDEGSANGVKIDGELISAPTLVDATNRIGISSFTLTVEPAEAAASADRIPELAPDDEDALLADTRLEAQPPPAGVLARHKLRLVGRGGAYHRTRYGLETPLVNVGRDDGNEIVLEDPSISRRHAQLRVGATGERVTVLDLRSHNGTFLNGKRIKRAEAVVGDVIRFGDVAFKLEQLRGEGKRAPRRAGRKRLLAGGVAAVVALLGVAGWLAYERRARQVAPTTRGALDALRERQEKIREALENARRKAALKDWAAAIAQLDEVLLKDPLSAEAKRLKEQALAERQHEGALREAIRRLGIGQREDLLRAREVLSGIPESSTYHREARYRIKEARTKLAAGYLDDGRARCRSREWEACHETLCQFFSLTALDEAIADEENLRGLLAQAERKLQRREGFAPCQAPRYVSSDLGPRSDDADALLAKKYPVEAVRAVVASYVKGNVEGALHRLSKMRDDRAMRPHEQLVAELSRQLLIIHGKYQSGYSAYREKKAEEADEHWKLLLLTDRAVVPEGVESALSRDVLRMLGDLYYELGEEQFKAKRFREAYRLWARGAEINAKHDRLLNGLLDLEKTAARLAREAEQLAAAGNGADARSKLDLAQGICKPSSPVRAEIDRILGGL